MAKIKKTFNFVVEGQTFYREGFYSSFTKVGVDAARSNGSGVTGFVSPAEVVTVEETD